MANDGRPTTTPTPGHPLLRGGKLLVYPPGFECFKCAFLSFRDLDLISLCVSSLPNVFFLTFPNAI